MKTDELLFKYQVRLKAKNGYKYYDFYSNTKIEEFLNKNNFDYHCIGCVLTEEVEILEEKKKIPEKLEKYYDENLEEYVVETYIKGVNYKEIFNSKYDEMIISKLNEVLDYLKSKGK